MRAMVLRITGTTLPARGEPLRFPLGQANEALDALQYGPVRGATLLVP